MVLLTWPLAAGEITGVIGSYTDASGRSYFGVAVEHPLVLKASDGSRLKTYFPQLAGLDEKNYAEANRLMGQRARITGRPMERHTVHHLTPVLWLADEVIPAKEKKSPPSSLQRVEEVPRGSALRKKLFDLARPEAEKAAGQKVKFEGSMKRLGDWVCFSGNVVDDRGSPIIVQGFGSDTVALWKRVDGKWRVLDVGAGATDAYELYVWPENFGTPMELLRAR